MVQSSKNDSKAYGPAIVSAANAARAFDAPVRTPLIYSHTASMGGIYADPFIIPKSSSFIALVEHLIGFLILSPILLYRRGLTHFRDLFKTFDRRDWFSACYISMVASALGLFFFMIALGSSLYELHNSNITVAILIQKSQPLITLIFAMAVLHERPSKRFYIALSVAVAGIFLMSWPNIEESINNSNYFLLLPVIASLLAAICWGGGTVFGRILTEKADYWDMTLIRYTGGFLFLVVINIFVIFTSPAIFDILSKNIRVFGADASPYGPASIINTGWSLMGLLCICFGALLTGGMLPLAVYYYGLRMSKASIAGLAELAFPLLAIFVNFLFLNENLTMIQLLGAAVLLVTVSFLSYLNAKEVEQKKTATA